MDDKTGLDSWDTDCDAAFEIALPPRWEFRDRAFGSPGIWRPFPESVSAEINALARRGQRRGNVSMGGSELVVDLQDMVAMPTDQYAVPRMLRKNLRHPSINKKALRQFYLKYAEDLPGNDHPGGPDGIAGEKFLTLFQDLEVDPGTDVVALALAQANPMGDPCQIDPETISSAIVCTTSVYVMLNEHVEHGIFKSYTLHNHWELAGSQARLPDGTADSPLLVFQHIPRTSGDSMQTHLFRDKTSAFSSSSTWPHEFKERWAETFFPAEVAPTCAYPWDYSCTFTLNSMTWQLGGDQHCASRSAADANEVLARAKQALEEAAFVGFYETLDADFWALKENIFPGVQLPRYVPAAFWLGAWLSLPRLRVLKFSAGLSDDALDCIRQHLDLDLELYEWPLKRFKPDLVLFTSYRGFFWGHPCYTLTLGFLLLLLTSACQYCCRLCGRAAPRESSAARGQPSQNESLVR
ncbi:unnamed protein product [Polarella glacialis]|uniref:WWE domain-containing protein n=1 Tax=Polarella glacialis TaxID=89957 RepID=A0A813E494_POLGL|nr:unnamed protein product [Polarella glacialis]